jgi:hypothetical protein
MSEVQPLIMEYLARIKGTATNSITVADITAGTDFNLSPGVRINYTRIINFKGFSGDDYGTAMFWFYDACQNLGVTKYAFALNVKIDSGDLYIQTNCYHASYGWQSTDGWSLVNLNDYYYYTVSIYRPSGGTTVDIACTIHQAWPPSNSNPAWKYSYYSGVTYLVIEIIYVSYYWYGRSVNGFNLRYSLSTLFYITTTNAVNLPMLTRDETKEWNEDYAYPFSFTPTDVSVIATSVWNIEIDSIVAKDYQAYLADTNNAFEVWKAQQLAATEVPNYASNGPADITAEDVDDVIDSEWTAYIASLVSGWDHAITMDKQSTNNNDIIKDIKAIINNLLVDIVEILSDMLFGIVGSVLFMLAGIAVIVYQTSKYVVEAFIEPLGLWIFVQVKIIWYANSAVWVELDLGVLLNVVAFDILGFDQEQTLYEPFTGVALFDFAELDPWEWLIQLRIPNFIRDFVVITGLTCGHSPSNKYWVPPTTSLHLHIDPNHRGGNIYASDVLLAAVVYLALAILTYLIGTNIKTIMKKVVSGIKGIGIPVASIFYKSTKTTAAELIEDVSTDLAVVDTNLDALIAAIASYTFDQKFAQLNAKMDLLLKHQGRWL